VTEMSTVQRTRRPGSPPDDAPATIPDGAVSVRLHGGAVGCSTVHPVHAERINQEVLLVGGFQATALASLVRSGCSSLASAGYLD